MTIVFLPVGKYDTADQGYDESLYDNAALQDAITMGVVDVAATSGSLARPEAIGGADTISTTATHALAEAVSIIDSIVKSASRALAEAISIVDTKINTALSALAETIGLVDAITSRTASIGLSITLGITDAFKKSVNWVQEVKSAAIAWIEETEGTAISSTEETKNEITWTKETKI